MLTTHVRSPICAVLTAVKVLLSISRNWRIAGTPMERKNATMLFRMISDTACRAMMDPAYLIRNFWGRLQT